MANLNKVMLIGNLTKDAELRYIPSGQPVLEFRLAVSRRYRTQAGEDREESLFIDVSLWGRRGEAVSRFLTRGTPLFVEGRLKLDQWEREGQRRSKISVVAQNIEFLGRRNGPEDGEARGQGQPQENGYARNQGQGGGGGNRRGGYQNGGYQNEERGSRGGSSYQGGGNYRGGGNYQGSSRYEGPPAADAPRDQGASRPPAAAPAEAAAAPQPVSAAAPPPPGLDISDDEIPF